MPELIMERPKMSLQMHENLKKFILRERRKKKEEDEQKMREELKKAEIKTQTLEQNKDQMNQLQNKLEELQLKRRELFIQLKKVLNEETNLKKSNRSSMPPSSTTGSEQTATLNPLLMYSGHPGHPQLLAPQNPQFVSQPPAGIVNLPQPSPILSIPNIPSSQSNQNTLNNLPQSNIINKPQSPFHPPHLIPSQQHHLPPTNPSNFLKYFQNQQMQMPPQMLQNQPGSLLIPPSNILNQNPMASPSSSPHLITSSPRHSIQHQQAPPPKRQRSPTPPGSPLPGSMPQNNLLHNQLLFNQSQLMQQRSISPGNMIPSPSPPILAQGPQFNSPSSSKKIRNNNVPQSPQQMPRQNQMPPQQSQSAFSSYLNRPGLPNFQSPSSQNKHMPNTQSYPGGASMPSHTPPGPGYQYPRGLPPQQSPHAHMPPLPQHFNQHYLNSLSQEQAKIIMSQQQQHQQHQYMPQSYLNNIPIISAAAAAAVAAAAANVSNPNERGSTTTSGSGSIMTGYSIRNPNNQ
ncbi:unnamed protein product [Brachionus calyciflorus]|uniref:G protein pathway suppressor 2 n=1 Tax=Brachionus calyciflorus TaxID=104777 RepID=A0A813MIF5_9BILA|nr:unnamed protein product [Brachionus calyciflorus]